MNIRNIVHTYAFFDTKINISPKNRSALDALSFITFMKHEKKCMYYVRKERLEEVKKKH